MLFENKEKINKQKVLLDSRRPFMNRVRYFAPLDYIDKRLVRFIAPYGFNLGTQKISSPLDNPINRTDQQTHAQPGGKKSSNTY
jgi:hypothetical protein